MAVRRDPLGITRPEFCAPEDAAALREARGVVASSAVSSRPRRRIRKNL